MGKIRVLNVIRRAEGGMKKHLLSLLRMMDKEKYDVAVACSFDKDTKEYIRKIGVEVFDVDICDSINPAKDYVALRKLRYAINNFKPDIVHMHGAKAALVGRVACLYKPCYTVVTVHNFPGYEYMNRYKKKVFLLFNRFLNKRTSQFITVSDALKKEIAKVENINEDKIKTIYNCIDKSIYVENADFNLKDYLNIPQNSIVVGCIARLIPSKGVQDLIAAANVLSELNSLYFAVAGDGPMMGELKKMVDGLNLNRRFFFLGYRNDIPDFLRNIDIFVLPSHQEGFGLSIAEALGEGVPVIATSVGGIPEIIQDGTNGILVEQNNIDMLANEIRHLAFDRDYREKLSKEGIKTVEQKFTCRKMYNEIERIYYNLKER